jgi:hypothetical protein
MDQIKRANRLWSNDLAFVKETLIIPIDREKLKELNTNYTDELDDLNTNQIEIDLSNGKSKSSSFNGDSNGTIKNENDNNNDTENVKDILNKYDTFINESKLKLKSLKTMSKYDFLLCNFLNLILS